MSRPRQKLLSFRQRPSTPVQRTNVEIVISRRGLSIIIIIIIVVVQFPRRVIKIFCECRSQPYSVVYKTYGRIIATVRARAKIVRPIKLYYIIVLLYSIQIEIIVKETNEHVRLNIKQVIKPLEPCKKGDEQKPSS